MRGLYRTIREAVANATKVYTSLTHEEWLPEAVNVISIETSSNNLRIVDRTYVFTDGRLVYRSGNTSSRSYRVRNATWLVYLLVIRHERGREKIVELGVSVHGSEDIYRRVRRFLRRLSLIK